MKTLVVFLILLFAFPSWGSNIYIDASLADPNTGEDGSFANPWNKWTDFTISAGSDYRQKCGTTYTGVIGNISIDATADPIILGAYYDDSGAVHEDDSPSFGQNCGNAAEKPKIDTSAVTGDDTIDLSSASKYIEINSLQFYDSSQRAAEFIIDTDGDYITVRYCYTFGGGRFVNSGSGSDHNTYEYNYIDGNENDADGDQIGMLSPFWISASDHNTIQYNHMGNYDHGGVDLNASDNNTIQYNYIFKGTEGGEDYAIGIAGPSGGSFTSGSDNNIIRYNYAEDAGKGFQMWAGLGNEIYANVFSCNGPVQPKADGSCMSLYHQDNNPYDGAYITGNHIYNNVVYDADRLSGTNGLRIRVAADADSSNDISGNYFVNNVFQKMSGDCIFVRDLQGAVIGTNYFYNNSCYDFGDEFGNMFGVGVTKTEFNALGYASNNRDNDPEISDPANDEFWPDESDDDVVGNGCDMNDSGSDCYDASYTASENLIDPTGTDFTTSYPVVALGTQPNNWYIGAYQRPSALVKISGGAVSGGSF